MLAGTALVVAGAVVLTHPLEPTMPVYGQLAEQMRRETLTRSFEPLGYPWLISRMPAESIATAAKVLHLLCYAMLVAIVTAMLHSRRTLAVLLAASWVLFNPYVIVNLYRLNDNNIDVVAVLIVFALIWRADSIGDGASAPPVIAAGVTGALALVRPNVVTLLAAIVGAALLHRRSSLRSGQRWMLVGSTVVALAAGYVVASRLVTGQTLFRPGNGGYNVFAGNNPFALRAIWADYNAEPSIADGIGWCGITGAPRSIDSADYTGCAMKYARTHPADVVKLTVVKLYNLMWRPNLRLASSLLQQMAQYAAIVPSVTWWLATAVVLIRRRRLLDPIAMIFVVAFALPFVLTNSDPRFRLPLDSVFALSLSSPLSLRALREAM